MGLRVLGTMGLQWDNWVFVSWGGGLHFAVVVVKLGALR